MTGLVDSGHVLQKNFPFSNFRTIDLRFASQAFGREPNALPQLRNWLIQRILAPRGGFEPPTFRLTAECSTIELPGNRQVRLLFYNTMHKRATLLSQLGSDWRPTSLFPNFLRNLPHKDAFALTDSQRLSR
jgi:hypothetical protein